MDVDFAARAREALGRRAAPDARRTEATLRAQVGRAVALQLEACVNCGQCAEACHFHIATGDPRYTPVHKLRLLRDAYRRELAPFPRLARWLHGAPAAPSTEELARWSELVFDSCNLCGRCTLACPMGIDIAGLVRSVREGLTAGGFAPADLYAAAQRALDTGSPLGLRWHTLERRIRDQEAETGIPVPVDAEGADHLVILSSIEIANYPEGIGALARIFHHAGVSWTISSKCFEATNVGVQIGSRELAATLVARVVAAAERLRVKVVIGPECGHAYTALRWEGPNLIGRRYAFEVLHIAELLERLVRDGRLLLAGKDARRLTFHDPCQLVRRGGVVAEPERLAASVSANFAPMPQGGVASFCCGGGGGVSAIRRAEALRFAAFACKKRQIEATGAEALVTACSNCRNVLEEAIDHEGMTLPVLGLSELLSGYLEPAGATGTAASA